MFTFIFLSLDIHAMIVRTETCIKPIIKDPS